MSYELTEEDHARMEREDERREFSRQPRLCRDCLRMIYTKFHDCPDRRPEIR